jgi:hypothetical protein
MAAIPKNNLGAQVTKLDELRGKILAAIGLQITGI